MKSAQEKLQNLTAFEELAESDSPLNRVGAVVKIAVAAIFILMLISINKYDVIHSLFMTSFTFFLFALSPLKIKAVAKLMLYLSPFIILLVAFNPVLDKEIISIGTYRIPGGYVSAFTTVIKFINTTILSVIIVSSTTFYNLASALRFFKVPRYFVIQFMVMYRFIFLFLYDIILTVESVKARKFSTGRLSWKIMKAVISSFFVKSIIRGEDIYSSMLSKGFDIDNYTFGGKIVLRDVILGLCSVFYVSVMRFI